MEVKIDTYGMTETMTKVFNGEAVEIKNKPLDSLRFKVGNHVFYVEKEQFKKIISAM